ncbi:MipA/OmpV family protein [Serratia aquatilis]|uniref:MipA/OmpV family protein n=1 Tax=Serratia aquatilis TaxID=1737515 RepID=A0ABV6EDF5_9GAMM
MNSHIYSAARNSFLPISTVSLAALLFSNGVFAGEWSVGAGVLAEKLPYHQYKTQFIPLPIVTYQGEQFFINSQGIGLNMLNTEKHNLHLAVNYSPLNFNPSESDDPAMKQLDKRRATAMAGIGYQYHADWGTLSGEVATDILGYSKGSIVDVGYQYSFQFNKLQLIPSVGMRWQSRSFNDYYFGVSQQESQRSKLREYQANSGVSSYLSLASHYAVNDNWQLFLLGRYEQMSDAVKDSPMTARDYNVLVATGVVYRF